MPARAPHLTARRTAAARVLRRLWGRSPHQEPWWAEWWAALAAVGWGALALAVSPDLGAVPSFRIVLGIADERFWWASGVALGLAQVFALRHGMARARWWLALVMGWWWMVLTLAVVLGDRPLRPGVALYAAMAAINHYSVLRLRTPPGPRAP